MFYLKKIAHKIRNRLLGNELTLIRQELNEISSLKEELESLSKNFYTYHECMKDQMIQSKSKKIKVILFFQQLTLWECFKSVYEELNANDNFDCQIIVTPFFHDVKNYENQEAREFLEKENVDYTVYDEANFDLSLVDIAFFQTPYDCSRPQELAITNLVKKGIKIAYIPYCFDIVGGEDSINWQYNLDCQNHAKWVFVRSTKNRESFGKFCSSGNSHVFVTGHPKFDQVDYSIDKDDHKSSRKVFLWTPHFSIGEGGWSTFGQFSDVITSAAKANTFDLIIRPHPLFTSRLESCSDELKDQFQRLLKAVDEYDNITFDSCEGSYIDSFMKSDILIADAGSFLLEYLPSRKPIIYLERTDGPGLNESGSFVEHLYTASNKSELIEHIGSILDNKDYKKEQRLSVINDEIYSSKHSAAYEICNTILDTYEIK